VRPSSACNASRTAVSSGRSPAEPRQPAVHRRDQRPRTRCTVSRDSQFRRLAQEGLRVGPLLALLAAADENDGTTPGPDET
jgi:hypothetical protein